MNSTHSRILAIDDTPANLMTLGAALSEEFDLQIATSGQQGLLLAAESPPNLILLDIMMPVMDGYEVCRRLKADPKLSHIPVIFVTALDNIGAETQGLSLGAVDYIAKPINVEIARQRIRNQLDREYLRAEVEAQRDQLAAQVENLQKLTVAVEQCPASVVITDLNAIIEYVNPRFCEITQYSESEVIGQNPNLLQSGLTNPVVYQDMWDTLAAGHVWKGELLNKRKTGDLYWEEAQIAPVKNGLGTITHYVAVKTDITKRKEIEAKLQLSANVFSHAREGIMITDANGTIIDVNETFSRITGYSKEEAVGRNPRMLKSGRQNPEGYGTMWSDLTHKGHWYGEVWNRRKNGEVYAEMLTISAVYDAEGVRQHFVALFSDITPIKTNQQQLEHIAHYDVLTGLPNRLLLSDRLQQALLQVQRRKNFLAVAFIDLDGFKAVNDNYGHATGDELLILLTLRMKTVLREGDTLARIGGDEFVAILVDLERPEDFRQILTRMLLAASDPIAIGNTTIQVSASIGVTLSPHDCPDPAVLIDHADRAMYAAKQSGKNCYRVFAATT